MVFLTIGSFEKAISSVHESLVTRFLLLIAYPIGLPAFQEIPGFASFLVYPFQHC